MQGYKQYVLRLTRYQVDIEESINLQNKINQEFNGNNGQLSDDFAQYIDNLIQQELKENTLINRLNQILQKQENNTKEITESFTRQEIYTLLLMMYFNLIDSDFKMGGFYQTNMENIRRANYYKGKEKHKCLLFYFKIFYEINRDNKEQVTFIRGCTNQPEIQNVEQSNEAEPIQQFKASKDLIEKVDSGSVIVDFADKNVGGLVLDGANCAQEEIMLLCYPEGIISMLFMRPIKDNEAIFIQNAIKYNNYTGYENSFKQQVLNIKNKEEFIIHHILIIDARQYYNPQEQFKQFEIQREIQKCYTGFKIALDHLKNQETIISTGKWGCGIFHGDLKLKFLIQIYGFSLAKLALGLQNQSSIRFSSFHDEEYLKMIDKYSEQLMTNKTNMATLKQIILAKLNNSKY